MASETSPISVRLNEKCLNNLDKLMLCSYSEESSNRSDKLRQLIQMTVNNYNATYEKMEGMFSELEMAYMCQAFNSTIVDYSLTDTHSLLMLQMRDFAECGSRGFFTDSDFDPQDLIDRLSELNEMQSFVIINTIVAFWKEASKNPSMRFSALGLVRQED